MEVELTEKGFESRSLGLYIVLLGFGLDGWNEPEKTGDRADDMENEEL
jgi:hypothetical protein